MATANCRDALEGYSSVRLPESGGDLEALRYMNEAVQQEVKELEKLEQAADETSQPEQIQACSFPKAIPAGRLTFGALISLSLTNITLTIRQDLWLRCTKLITRFTGTTCSSSKWS